MTSHHLPSSTHAGRLGRLLVVACLFGSAVPVLAEAPAPDEKRNTAFNKDRLYVRRIVDLRPLSIDGLDEKEPFEDVLLHARGFNGEELFKAARADVSYHDLMDDNKTRREEMRFELVRVEGKLKRLKRIPTLASLKEVGVDDLYEAWIFPKGGRGTDPVCVILSEPPAGVEPADDFTPGIPVATAGYFFKLLEYQSNQPNPKDPNRTMYRRAPLLLGRSITTSDEARQTGSSVPDLATISLALGGVVLVVLIGLAIWLRRSDGGSRRAYSNRLRNPYTPPPDYAPPGEPSAGTGTT